ncbi:MAG TPA: glycine betaine ABC transporter substrate-binding protein, partial [Citricoccus sp.]
GGPLTVKALVDGDVQLADIYSADPSIEAQDLVTLEDPENLVLPQNITPVVSDAVDEQAAAVIEEVNAQLSAEELIGLNRKSVEDQSSSADIARQWLADQGLS